jgi:drug/metabolite transporter (DMT)-like permease
MLIILIQRKGKVLLNLCKRDWIKAIALGLLGTYLYYILLYFGYAKAKGIEVLIIQYCWPIFVIILSILILKERINKYKVLSILLGFSGIFMVLSKGDVSNIHFDNLFVDFIVLLAAFVFGLFSVLSKRINIDSLSLTSIYFFTALIASFVSMMVFSDFQLPSSKTILPILINGIFVNGISYIFWIKALKLGKASFVAPFVFLTPVISTILIILFFNEPFHLVYIIGMSLVIVSGLVNRN